MKGIMPVQFIGGPLDGETRDIDAAPDVAHLRGIVISDWNFSFQPNLKADYVAAKQHYTMAGIHTYDLDADRYRYRGVTG